MDNKIINFYCGYIQTNNNVAMIHIRKEDSDKIDIYNRLSLNNNEPLTKNVILTEMASMSAYLIYNDILSNESTENDSEGDGFIIITYIDDLNNFVTKLVNSKNYTNILNELHKSATPIYISSYSLGKRYGVIDNNHNIIHAKFKNMENNGNLTFNIEDYLKSNETIICEIES